MWNYMLVGDVDDDERRSCAFPLVSIVEASRNRFRVPCCSYSSTKLKMEILFLLNFPSSSPFLSLPAVVSSGEILTANWFSRVQIFWWNSIQDIRFHRSTITVSRHPCRSSKEQRQPNRHQRPRSSAMSLTIMSHRTKWQHLRPNLRLAIR